MFNCEIIYYAAQYDFLSLSQTIKGISDKYFKTLLICANHKIAGATCMKDNDHITLGIIPLNAICGKDYHFRENSLIWKEFVIE